MPGIVNSAKLAKFLSVAALGVPVTAHCPVTEAYTTADGQLQTVPRSINCEVPALRLNWIMSCCPLWEHAVTLSLQLLPIVITQPAWAKWVTPWMLLGTSFAVQFPAKEPYASAACQVLGTLTDCTHIHDDLKEKEEGLDGNLTVDDSSVHHMEKEKS